MTVIAPVVAFFAGAALVTWLLSRPVPTTHAIDCDLDEDCSCGADGS